MNANTFSLTFILVRFPTTESEISFSLPLSKLDNKKNILKCWRRTHQVRSQKHTKKNMLKVIKNPRGQKEILC